MKIKKRNGRLGVGAALATAPAAVALSIGLTGRVAADEGAGAACAGCEEQSSAVGDDTTMTITAKQAAFPAHFSLCMIDVQAIVGGFLQSCSSSSSHCSSAKCWKTYQLQAKASPFVQGGCDGVYFDLESQRESGGWSSEWENISPGNHSAGGMTSGGWQDVEPVGSVDAGCGAGATTVNVRFDTSRPPIPSSSTTYWGGPNETSSGGTPISDDLDINITVGCVACIAPWDNTCCGANPTCCTGGIPDAGLCCDHTGGGGGGEN